MTSKEMMGLAVKILDSKKAENIEVLKVDDVTILADYFVIASGTNSTQVKALAEEIDYRFSKRGMEPHHTEGRGSTWILMDYSSVIVHVFYKDTREFYALERLWTDAQKLDINEVLEAAPVLEE